MPVPIVPAPMTAIVADRARRRRVRTRRECAPRRARRKTHGAARAIRVSRQARGTSCARRRGLRRTACRLRRPRHRCTSAAQGSSCASRAALCARSVEEPRGVGTVDFDVAHALARPLLRRRPSGRKRERPPGDRRRRWRRKAGAAQFAAGTLAPVTIICSASLDADHARQPLRAAGAGQDAELHLRQARSRRRGVRHPKVAAHRELQPAAHAGAADRGDDRLAARLDRADHRAQASAPRSTLAC